MVGELQSTAVLAVFFLLVRQRAKILPNFVGEIHINYIGLSSEEVTFR